MLINQSQYELTIWIWIGIAICTFFLLMFIRAPYGRHERPGWGIRIPARVGWVVMESPCIIVMTILFCVGLNRWASPDLVGIVFYSIWMLHYIHRSWVWPQRANISNKKMPISIALFAVGFNSINAWINAEWIYSINHPYPIEWIHSPQFLLGIILFFVGMGINIHSDNILFALRKKGKDGYKIPFDGLFKWISCPNYFGEIIEWIGWAIATWSLAGLSFAVWVIANLVPRSRSNHQWYIEKFEEYPKDRKILIPKIW